jgi:hypothetical protein
MPTWQVPGVEFRAELISSSFVCSGCVYRITGFKHVPGQVYQQLILELLASSLCSVLDTSHFTAVNIWKLCHCVQLFIGAWTVPLFCRHVVYDELFIQKPSDRETKSDMVLIYTQQLLVLPEDWRREFNEDSTGSKTISFLGIFNRPISIL